LLKLRKGVKLKIHGGKLFLCSKNRVVDEKRVGQAFGCKSVSMNMVIEADSNGAKSVDEVVEIVGAGTGIDCGRCKALIKNILHLVNRHNIWK
jgi:NAD(P)H-nitrite reductase large subunit